MAELCLLLVAADEFYWTFFCFNLKLFSVCWMLVGVGVFLNFSPVVFYWLLIVTVMINWFYAI